VSLTAFALECYFAAVLAVSGLAKADQPERFAMTLHRHGILPRRSIPAISRVFPRAEVALAGWLVTGVATPAAILVILLLFAVFGIIETILVVTRRATECGCYGVAFPQKVDRASIATSMIVVLLAGADLWLTRQTTPLIWYWQPGRIALFVTGVGWLAWRLSARRRSWQRQATLGLLVAPPAG